MQDPLPFDAVLLDLDGVLVETRWEAALAEHGRTRADWLRIWVDAGWGARLSTGACEPAEFALAADEALGLGLGPEGFLSLFGGLDVGPLPGAIDLLTGLRRHVPAACLSNTNAPFVARYRRELDLPSWFDRCYFSSEIGLCKPDPAVFHHVLADLGVAPGRLLYLDDAERHVASARSLGILAERVEGVDGARAALAAHGLVLTER